MMKIKYKMLPFLVILLILGMHAQVFAFGINPINQHQYKIFTGNYTWEEANSIAQGEGYYLATITEQSEQAFIESLLSGYSGEFWLGGIQDADDVWTWFNGDPWSYAHWQTGEPNDWGGDS